MKNRKMYEALTEIHEKYIESAYPAKRRKAGKAVIAAVLCAAILLSLGAGIAMHLKNNTQGETTAPTVNIPSYDEGGSIKNVSADISATMKEGKEADAKFISAVNDFSVRLLQAQMKEGENTLLSPLSAMYALSMTANGADGQTLSQMEQVLGGELSIDELNEYLRGLYARLLTEGNGIKSANSIWIRDKFSPAVSPMFLEKNAHYYEADVYTAPFNPDLVKEVNKWAYDNTDGMIDEIIEDIDPDAVMLLLNSLLFESEWEAEIKTAYNGKFANANGTESVVTMMKEYGQAKTYYVSDLNSQGFVKKLTNGCSFFAILPSEGLTADEYASSLTGEDLFSMLNGATNENLEVCIPVFSTYTQNSLKEALIKMGMSDAFSSNADFSRLSSGSTFLDQVQQNNRLDLTTRGVKAASVTIAITKGEGFNTIELNFNRPFVYGIMTEDGIPLFIGVQNQI